MAKKKQTGGRKPIDPEKRMKLVGFYTRQDTIARGGGIANIREEAKIFIEDKYGINGATEF